MNLCLLLPLLARAQTPAQGSPGGPIETGNPDLEITRQNNALPLTPEMIRDLRRQADERNRAAEEPIRPEIGSRPVNRSVSVSLAPGGTTPIIQTAAGNVTALAFFDSTGAPWPIAYDTNSNPAVNGAGFDLKVPVKGSNVLEITPRSSYPSGNALVTLKDSPAPLPFMLISGQAQVDYRVDVRVADRGPNARTSLINRTSQAPETGAPYLNAMLDGVAPAQATPLAVSGVSPDAARAWRIGDHVYLRTRFTVISPQWDAYESSADGTSIYALPASPVVLVSAEGRTVPLRLQDR